MLRHIVLFKFKPEASREELAQLVQRLRALPPLIPEIRAFEVGEDTFHWPRSFDLAVVSLFDDVEAFKRYQDHPEHVPVAQGLRANAAQVVSVDYDLPAPQA